MRHNTISAKLLIIIVDEQHTKYATEIIKNAGATGGTRTMGRGTAPYMSIGDSSGVKREEGLIFSVSTDNAEEISRALEQAALEEPQKLTGMVMLVDVPNILLSLRQIKEQVKNSMQSDERNKAMESGATLIVCIINSGHADDIMASAREAGARGGTIVDARGTGTAEDTSFYGISLVPEKEMLLIVADNGTCPAILSVISDSPIFSEPGAGIVFTIAIEHFLPLGKQQLGQGEGS